MEELDDLGVPIKKKAEAEVDDLGVPLKKKITSEPVTSTAPTGSVSSETISKPSVADIPQFEKPQTLYPEAPTATTTFNPNQKYRDTVLDATLHTFQTNPIFEKPENRQIYYKRLASKGIKPAILDQVIHEGENAYLSPSQKLGQHVANIGTNTIEAPGQMADAGLKTLKEVPEAYNESETIAGGVGNAALQAVKGVGELAMGAASVTPPGVVFNAIANTASEVAPQATHAVMAPVTTFVLNNLYKDEPAPRWAQNASAILDFLTFAKGLHLASKGVDAATKVNDINKILNEVDPKELKAYSDKLEQQYGETKNVYEIPEKEAVDLDNNINAVKTDLQNNPDLAEILEPKLQKLTEDNDALQSNIAATAVQDAHIEAIKDVANEGIKELEAKKKELSPASAEAVDETINTLRHSIEQPLIYVEAKGGDVMDPALKGRKYESEMISPEDYIKETGGYESTTIDQKKVDKIKEKIKNGVPLDPITLTFKEGSNVGQEGRHRAEAARQLGIPKIPLVRINGELPFIAPSININNQDKQDVQEPTRSSASDAPIEENVGGEIAEPKEVAPEPVSKGIGSEAKSKEGENTTESLLNEAEQSNSPFAELAKVLRDKLVGVKTSIVDGLKGLLGEKTGGILEKDHIKIDSKNDKLNTFFHEALHHVTFDKVSQFERGDLSKLSDVEVDAIKNIKRIFEESKAKAQELLGGGKKDRTKSHYGFTNTHEFISEAFSNPEFQRLLKKLPTEGKSPTLLKQFLNAVAEMLGLKDPSILDDIFHHTEKLIEGDKKSESALTPKGKPKEEPVLEDAIKFHKKDNEGLKAKGEAVVNRNKNRIEANDLVVKFAEEAKTPDDLYDISQSYFEGERNKLKEKHGNGLDENAERNAAYSDLAETERRTIEAINAINAEANPEMAARIKADKIAEEEEFKKREQKRNDKPESKQDVINKIVSMADAYNSMQKGRLGRGKAEGVKALNDAMVAAKEAGFDAEVVGKQRTLVIRNKSGNKIRAKYEDNSNKGEAKDYTPLSERSPETQDAFKQLNEYGLNSFPTIRGADGKRMSVAQMRNAIADILNDVPSNGAKALLDVVDSQMQDGHFEIDHPEVGKARIPAKDYLESLKEENAREIDMSDAEENALAKEHDEVNPFDVIENDNKRESKEDAAPQPQKEADTAGKRKAEREYNESLTAAKESLADAEKQRQNKLNSLNKKVDLFEGKGKQENQLFDEAQDQSPEAIKAALKSYDDKISSAKKKVEELESNKDKELSKYNNQRDLTDDIAEVEKPKTVSIIHAGMKKSGEVTEIKDGHVYIKDKSGAVYNAKESDVIKEGESFEDALNRITKRKKREAAQTEKRYENAAGLAPRSAPGRIPVDPIVGKETKGISKIMRDVTEGMKQRLGYSKTGKHAGTYTPSSGAVKIKYVGDLDVTAHELGHSLDDRHAIIKDITPEIRAELSKFSDYGSKPPKDATPAQKEHYIKGEGFAEWLRAYVVNPAEAKLAAPKLYDLFESKISEADHKTIKQFSDDVRTFAGSTGRDMTLANIDIDPKKDNIISKVLGKDKEGNNKFTVTYADRLAANYLNPMRAFEKAIEYAKDETGTEKLLPENDPQLLARIFLGEEGKLADAMENGIRDAEGRILTDPDGNPKNLKWLIDPLLNTDEATINREMQDVMAYMVAERTVELSKKLADPELPIERENILTGIGGGIFKDLDVAKKTLQEFKDGDADKLYRIQEAADRYRDFADETLKYMVDKGRLSKEQYDLITKTNTQYVALNRIMETAPEQEISVFKGNSGALGSKKETIYKIQGSTRKIANPYASLLDTYNKSIKESDRNGIMQAFRDLLVAPRGMHDGPQNRLSDIGTIGKTGDKNTIPVFIDGKVEHWQFQKDIYESLRGLDNEAKKLPLFLTALPKVLRWTVTHFPTFAARNWVRDFQDRLIKSNENNLSNLGGIKDLFGKKQDYSDMAASGGLNAGYYYKDHAHYNGLMKEAIHDLSKNKKVIIVDPIRLKQIGNHYFNLLQKSETSNRIAEYRAAYRNAKKEGMDDYNASLYGAYKARDLMDFALMGHTMKWINQVIPFSNAAVRGLHRTVQAIKENPVGFAARTALWSWAPTLYLWQHNNKTEKDREQYNALPSYQRDMFWNWKVGDDNWLSIPRPYELSLAGAGIDRGLSATIGKDKKAFDGYGGTVAKSLTPVGEDNVAGPLQVITELMTNYDMFRDKNIIPPEEVKLDLSLRNTDRASNLGKAVQDAFGVDARYADYFIKHQFSYVGNAATKLSNEGEDKGGFDITDTGFFKRSPAYNSKPVQDFISYAQQWNLTRSPDYKNFNKIVGAYFDAETPNEKETIAETMRKYAEDHLDIWEKDNKKKLPKVINKPPANKK